ncbi:MAG TPA: hypothetical protein VIR29_15115 [Anseongella sp.]
MKKLFNAIQTAATTWIILMLGTPVAALACDVCEKNQPKALRGISHGTGPDSQWDMIIIAIAAVIVLLTLIWSVRYLVRPGETAPGHIKNIVVEK